MSTPLYPLKFAPVLEQTEWGGSLLGEYRQGDAAQAPIPPRTGISWELVDSGAMSSVVSNGPLAGQSLGELVAAHPERIAGRRHRAGQPFPVYIRILDVAQSLPLMVHPASSVGGATFQAEPCSKFWFSLAAEPDASVIVGIGARVTRLQVVDRLDTPGLETLLQVFPGHHGDAFYIPNQRVHSIGGGNLVWEVGNRVAVPLRVSGWGGGEPVDTAEQQEALRCIYFQDRQLGRISRDAGGITRTRKVPLVHHCPQFVVDEIRLCDHLFDHTRGISFHVLAMVSGAAEVHSDAGVETLVQGELACLPAGLGAYRVYVKGKTCRLLRVVLMGGR